MDIFEFAMDKEQFAEQYYRKLAESAPHKGLVSIFTMLADEEHTHYEVILKMKQGVPAEVADTILLTNAKTIFATKKPGKLSETAGHFISKKLMNRRTPAKRRYSTHWLRRKTSIIFCWIT